MDELERAMLLARTAKQLPPPPPPPTEMELNNRILVERVKHLEAAMARVLNELGIRMTPPDKTRIFPSVRQCVVATARHFEVSVHDIIGQSRKALNAHARHVAMYVAKQMTLATYPMIGRTFENRDHSTIMHGVHKIEKNRHADAELDRDINRISEEVLKESAPSGASEAAPPSRPPSGNGAASLPPTVGNDGSVGDS